MADIQTLDVKARGLVFTTLAEWLKADQDEEAFEEIKTVRPSDLLDSAQKGKWYPLEQLIELFEVCARRSDSPDNSWAEFGSYLCEVSLSTSFKGLIVFIDPVTLMRRIPLFWKRYFNAGDMRIEDVQAAQAILALGEPFGGDAVSAMFAGWLEHALEMIGASDITIETEHCRWQASWGWTED